MEVFIVVGGCFVVFVELEIVGIFTGLSEINSVAGVVAGEVTSIIRENEPISYQTRCKITKISIIFMINKYI